MNWIVKRNILNVKDERKRHYLKRIINNKQFKKLAEYDNLVLDLIKIDNSDILESIDDILDIDSFTHCKTFPLVISDIVNMKNIERLENFRWLIRICTDSSDIKYKLYMYFKYLSLSDRKKEKELCILADEVELEDKDYEKIVGSIFRNNNIEWISNFRLSIRPIINFFEYDEKLFDQFLKVDNCLNLKTLCHFVSYERQSTDFEYNFDKLIKIKDNQRLETMCSVIFDKDLKKSEHYQYVIDLLFKIEDVERLDMISEIVVDTDVLECSDFKEIITKICLIDNEEKLNYISKLSLDGEYIPYLLNTAIDKIIEMEDMDLLNSFNNLLTSYDLKVEDESNLLKLDFENKNFKDVILIINRILGLFEVNKVKLKKDVILNIIFNKILLMKDYQNMLVCLEEVLVQVQEYLADNLLEKNTTNVSNVLEEKINSFEGMQLTKKINSENV